MMTISLEIPEDILRTVKIPAERLEGELKKELALQLYRDRLISFANARRLAGLTRIKFHYLLGEQQISRHYDVEDYRKDLENLAKWEVQNGDGGRGIQYKSYSDFSNNLTANIHRRLPF